eukprot:121972_1
MQYPSWLAPIVPTGSDPITQAFTQGRQFERNYLLSLPQIRNAMNNLNNGATTTLPILPQISTATLPQIPIHFNSITPPTNPPNINPSNSAITTHIGASNSAITQPRNDPNTVASIEPTFVPSIPPIFPPSIEPERIVWIQCGIERIELKRVLIVIVKYKKCNRTVLQHYFILKIQKLLNHIWSILGSYFILKKGNSERAYWNINRNLWSDFETGLLYASTDIIGNLLYPWPQSLCGIWDEVVAQINGPILAAQREETELHKSWKETAMIESVQFDIESDDDSDCDVLLELKNANNKK